MIARFVAAAFTLALIAGCAPLVSGPNVQSPDAAQQLQQSAAPDATASAKYCRSTGGQVQKRIPVSGTNDSSLKQELVLSGSAQFCMYTKKDGSRIYTFLSTLYATKPTLAALAYYHAPKIPKSCQASDPAACYCEYVGGSDKFDDVGVADGAWVLEGAADVNLDACVFPDLSSIDSWGLTYHAEKVIRGIDLAKVLRYKGK